MATRWFQDGLVDWSPFYGYLGSAAFTLLGLLFVAVSLRLNIFRDARVADVRDFAQITLYSFLAPMVISGLALMPHEQPVMLAMPLLLVSVVGLAATIYLIVEWIRLNPQREQPAPGLPPRQVKGWVYVAVVGLAYVALAIVGVFFLLGSGLAFAILAVAEGWMLLTGTISAWIMLSNAGASGGP